MSGLVIEPNQYSTPVNFYFMARCVFGSRHARDMPITNIELCTVSRAHQAVTFEFTIPERATVVRAQVFDAIDLSIQVYDHDKAIFDFEGGWLAGL